MNQQPGLGDNKESEEEPVTQPVDSAVKPGLEKPVGSEPVSGVVEDEVVVASSGKSEDTVMEEDPVNPAIVFCIWLKQPKSNLRYKMRVPELCRNFRLVFFSSIHCQLHNFLVFFRIDLFITLFFVVSVLLLGVAN